jgi:3-dehydroquinate dehydratase-2
MSPRILVLNGPNLNLLGEREPEVYGERSWDDIEEELRREAAEMGLELECRQSNHEGVLVDWVQEARSGYAGLIINPGALTHYGYSLHDALRTLDMPVVEVHLSNIGAREAWRRESVISPVVTGMIAGFGGLSYRLALAALRGMIPRMDPS